MTLRFSKKLFGISPHKLLSFVTYIPKRIRIVVATLLMTVLLIVSSFFPFSDTWYLFIVAICITSYISTYIAIYDGINGVEWYMLFVMSIAVSVATYLFYFLLPVRWLTRLPLVIIFSLTYYATLLTSNIFNVGVEKSIQLYRAAFSVNYFLQTFIIFLLQMVVFTFKQNFILNGIASCGVAGLLSLQLFWSVNPESKFDIRLRGYALIVAAILMETSILISFIPFKTNVGALLMTSAYYSLTGIMHHHLGNRLFPNIIREYIFVFIFVCLLSFLTLQWR